MAASTAVVKNPSDRSAGQESPALVAIADSSSSSSAAAFFQSTLGLGLLGSLLVYLALPPWNLWPLAWIAPVPWLLLVR
ncbi:MAG TPA: hypothetical protein VGI75_00225, partial [Pirellulales bacterium]